jgi:hypothetical protein
MSKTSSLRSTRRRTFCRFPIIDGQISNSRWALDRISSYGKPLCAGFDEEIEHDALHGMPSHESRLTWIMDGTVTSYSKGNVILKLADPLCSLRQGVGRLGLGQ